MRETNKIKKQKIEQLLVWKLIVFFKCSRDKHEWRLKKSQDEKICKPNKQAEENNFYQKRTLDFFV